MGTGLNGYFALTLFILSIYDSLLSTEQPTYYIFGDAETDEWSREYKFSPPPPPGLMPPDRPSRMVLMADMGIGSVQSAHTYGNVEPLQEGGATFTWTDTGYTSYNTSVSIANVSYLI